MGSKQRFAEYETPGDLAGSEGDWRWHYPDYLGCCWSLDQNVGRIREELRRLDLTDNTLIVYASDHGCHFRTRNSEYKRSCHDASIRVPLIIGGPGFAEGRVVDELVSLIDLPPTLLTAAGAKLPSTLSGHAVQPLVHADRSGWPAEVFVQISESQLGRALRTNQWKYSIYAPNADPLRDPHSARYVEQYLYDLNHDPYEKNNLVTLANLSLVRADLAHRLIRRMIACGEPEPTIISC